MAVGVIDAWSISDCDRSCAFPLALRSRFARRKRMFAEDVSGRKTNMTIQMGPESHSNSHENLPRLNQRPIEELSRASDVPVPTFGGDTIATHDRRKRWP